MIPRKKRFIPERNVMARMMAVKTFGVQPEFHVKGYIENRDR